LCAPVIGQVAQRQDEAVDPPALAPDRGQGHEAGDAAVAGRHDLQFPRPLGAEVERGEEVRPLAGLLVERHDVREPEAGEVLRRAPEQPRPRGVRVLEPPPPVHEEDGRGGGLEGVGQPMRPVLLRRAFAREVHARRQRGEPRPLLVEDHVVGEPETRGLHPAARRGLPPEGHDPGRDRHAQGGPQEVEHRRVGHRLLDEHEVGRSGPGEPGERLGAGGEGLDAVADAPEDGGDRADPIRVV
jgi:hypothetical protein